MCASDGKAALTSRRLRWDPGFDLRFAPVLDGLQPEERSVVRVDMADLGAVRGGASMMTWHTLTGTPEACAARAAVCLRPAPKGLLGIVEGDGLEEVQRFQIAVQRLLPDDAETLWGMNWREDGEDFRVHLFFPETQAQQLRVDAPLLLPPDTVLRSRKNTYTGLTAFDAGGTSVCYRAVDEHGDRVLIKETYPISLGASLLREHDALTPVDPDPEMRQAVAAMLGRAVEQTIRERELETDLQNLRLEFFAKNIDRFRANNTYYTVYNDYGRGTLAEKRAKIPVREALVLTDRILQLLEELHGAGYLHLDISPENILLSTVTDGYESLKFIDLGSLIDKRYLHSRQSFPCKDGYSPFELFSAAGSGAARRLVGERSDTFSVAAVLYHLLTGKTVDWSVCRQGDRPIITPDAPAVQLSESWRVSFGNRGNAQAVRGQGLSPRVLDQLNDFLRKALTNNPHRRFQTAREMRDALGAVLRSLDDHLYAFDRMEMPEDFMAEDIRKEQEMLGNSSGLQKKLQQRLLRRGYEAADIRRTLESGKGAVLNRGLLADTRAAVQDYIRQYGDRYQEIVFIDESQYEALLFSGRMSGRHSGVHSLDSDESTLMVFYGREHGLKNGIVEMVDSQKQPVYSLEFMRPPGVDPHVIRILPARATRTAAAAARGSLVLFALLPVLLLGAAVWYMVPGDRLWHLISITLHPEYDPIGDGWLMCQIRNMVGDCVWWGPAAGGAPPVQEIFLNTTSLRLLECMQQWGLVPAGGMLLGTLLFFLASWTAAGRNRLSASAWMVLFSRWVGYVLANFGLFYQLTGDLWTTPRALVFNGVLLFLILIWPRLPVTDKNRSAKWPRWRRLCGVFGHWAFHVGYKRARLWASGLGSYGFSGLVYLAWSLFFAYAVDAALEYAAGQWKKESLMTRLCRRWLYKDEDLEWLEDDLLEEEE